MSRHSSAPPYLPSFDFGTRSSFFNASPTSVPLPFSPSALSSSALSSSALSSSGHARYVSSETQVLGHGTDGCVLDNPCPDEDKEDDKDHEEQKTRPPVGKWYFKPNGARVKRELKIGSLLTERLKLNQCVFPWTVVFTEQHKCVRTIPAAIVKKCKTSKRGDDNKKPGNNTNNVLNASLYLGRFGYTAIQPDAVPSLYKPFDIKDTIYERDLRFQRHRLLDILNAYNASIEKKRTMDEETKELYQMEGDVPVLSPYHWFLHTLIHSLYVLNKCNTTGRIYHMDIKPDNWIFLDRFHLSLSDWGIAFCMPDDPLGSLEKQVKMKQEWMKIPKVLYAYFSPEWNFYSLYSNMETESEENPGDTEFNPLDMLAQTFHQFYGFYTSKPTDADVKEADLPICDFETMYAWSAPALAKVFKNWILYPQLENLLDKANQSKKGMTRFKNILEQMQIWCWALSMLRLAQFAHVNLEHEPIQKPNQTEDDLQSERNSWRLCRAVLEKSLQPFFLNRWNLSELLDYLGHDDASEEISNVLVRVHFQAFPTVE